MPDHKYSITPAFPDGSKIRSRHYVVAEQVGLLPFGRRAYGDSTWVSIQDEPGGMYMLGDIWLQVLEIDGAPVARESWVAAVHMGRRVGSISLTAQDLE